MKRKTPILIQMEAVECGAAALGIILGYHKKFVPLEELRVSCGVSRDGSLAINIIKAAKLYGLEGKGYQRDLETLYELKEPFIAFWNFNHYIVVEGFEKDCVYINDPACGRRRLSIEEFQEGYSGVVLLFSKTELFETGGAPKRALPILLPRLKACKAPLFFSFLAGFLLVIPGLLLPALTRFFVDEILVKHLTDMTLLLLSGLLFTTLLVGALTFLQAFYLNRLNGKLSIRLSSQFLWRLLRLPVDFYSQRMGGEIAYRMDLNDSVIISLTGRIGTALISVLFVIIYGTLIFFYDWVIGVIAILSGIFSLGMMALIYRSRDEITLRLQQEVGKQAGIAIGGLQNIETLKASGSEGDFYSRWSGYFTKVMNTLQQLNRYNVLMTIIPPTTTFLAITSLLIFGGLRVLKGELSLGELLGLQALLLIYLKPITDLIFLMQEIQTVKGGLYRIDDIMSNDEDPHLLKFQKQGEYEKLSGELSLEKITFGYSKLSPPLIENFSLHLKPGKSVALVGPSGSGKSTIAKLVSGLYQPWGGEIYFDKKRAEELTRETFSRSCSVVDQNIFLFEGTIQDNLSLWDTTLPEQDLLKASQDAHIHEEIVQREQGYEAPVLEEGSNFSGGQKQRLEIARALSVNPSLLILDEATSALDARVEEEIMKSLRRRGCACIVIAHRLSTIRDCDEIIVLDQGKVSDRGSHEELKVRSSIYKELIQLEGALDNE